jgi:hypothetical protein
MNDQKRNEQREKLDAMYREEFLAMKRKGATVDLLREPAFVDLLKERVLERHAKELNEDPEIWAFLAENALDNASPQSLRELAAMVRKDGDFDTAYANRNIGRPSRTRRTVKVLPIVGAMRLPRKREERKRPRVTTRSKKAIARPGRSKKPLRAIHGGYRSCQ